MKGRISILASLLFSGGLIMLAIFFSVSLSPEVVKAEGGENCYSYPGGTYSFGSCTCKEYLCYEAGTESWRGGSMPSSGTETRYGEWCSNGYGYTLRVNGTSDVWGKFGEGCANAMD